MTAMGLRCEDQAENMAQGIPRRGCKRILKFQRSIYIIIFTSGSKRSKVNFMVLPEAYITERANMIRIDTDGREVDLRAIACLAKLEGSPCT